MKKSALLLCSASLLLSSSVLKADTLTASLYSPLAPSGGTTVSVDLSGISPLPSQSMVNGSGYTISFSGVGSNEGVVQGSSSGAYAAPVAGVSGSTPLYLTGGFGSSLTSNIANSANYLSTGVGTITLTFSTPQNSFALLWGSIDIGNTLSFNDAADYTVTGADVQAAAAGFVSNGFQGPGGSAYVVVDTTTDFTTVTFTSTVVSFESADFAASDVPFQTSATPEPESLMLVGTGLAGVAGSLYRRSRKLVS
jgi:PEP-CTERM motif